ncbi:hypothetical protein [Terricaulis silvestris]|uniref:Putative phosphoesterase (MutT family) n=1 Tax=Terricaulis silvestris TaxID=2686094 RepID=A0A6I6MJU3_9CAUL|nr:hypothetical protein [Terricaulis silvestris]QGZ93204.1 putative phosphoesterase (MutT family) [Terricaulis silvestris]
MSIDDKVTALETKAVKVHSHLRYGARAFVIEFAGTPKAGKSTAVEAVRHFFSRQNFRVHILSERAAQCPIPMKGHLFFNTWCATSMLAELLENIETDTDIIIVDRGIFDSLVWLLLQRERGELTQEEADTIEAFLLLERWRSLIDLSIVMSVDADTAMKREVAQRITKKPGSIMNTDVLNAITRSVRTATDKYEKDFPKILSLDTSGSSSVRESNADLANNIVDCLEEFLNPEILVVPREEIEKIPLEDGGSFSASSVEVAIECIRQHGTYMRRADAENTESVVQIIPAGVLTSKDTVFIFQRKENDPKSKLFGKATVWQGTHVSKVDGQSGEPLLKAALLDRLMRSLFLSREFATNVKGYCWDPDEPHSSKHFGVIFQVEIDNVHTATDLRKKEFRRARGRGHDLTGRFTSWDELDARVEELALESWSRAILKGRSVFS